MKVKHIHLAGFPCPTCRDKKCHYKRMARWADHLWAVEAKVFDEWSSVEDGYIMSGGASTAVPIYKPLPYTVYQCQACGSEIEAPTKIRPVVKQS